MMISTTKRGNRAASTAVLAVGGSALAVATWFNGDHGLAVALTIFYVAGSAIAWIWSGRSGDVAAIMRAGGDERQRTLDLRATAYSSFAAVMFALTAAVVQTARGENALPYLLVCGVAGAAYVVALAILRRRS
ncbi:MAG: hypothetical protein QOG49_518 [Frankiaceae bacterium]|jgi:hypothetical protein|nr:hypothetical protein [Frankiaceae bacterium]